MSGTTGFQDVASQYLNNRLDQAQQNIQTAGQFVTNPQQAIQERISNAPVAPAQPQTMQQPMAQPQEQEVKPVSPNEVQQPTLPQPGPGVQVAGPAQLPTQPSNVPTEVQAPQTPNWTEQVGKIANDEKGLAAYIANSENSPEGIKFAKQQLQQLWSNGKDEKKAEAMVNSAVQDRKSTRLNSSH